MSDRKGFLVSNRQTLFRADAVRPPPRDRAAAHDDRGRAVTVIAMARRRAGDGCGDYGDGSLTELTGSGVGCSSGRVAGWTDSFFRSRFARFWSARDFFSCSR